MHGQASIRKRAAALVAVVLAAASLAGCNGRGGSGLWQRERAPVVMTGSQVPSFATKTPGSIVAFRWNSEERGWEQVPVQVDERHTEFLTKLRNGSGTSGPTTLAYSDPAAHAGSDPVATLDSNDEITFMAIDAGGEAPRSAPAPAGVVAASGLRVAVTDPLSPTDSTRGWGVGFLYLFERATPTLLPAAGRDYVHYTFAPADPTGHVENSTVFTDRYTTHFSARWTRDGLWLGDGPDILDRHRNLFAVGNCVRNEDTFSAGVGGFATNVNGPVRVIRSYLGANSGTYAQREHIFYRGVERVQTTLRVHAIPGILDFYDYSAAAIGMEYSNSSNPAGVTIDGVSDIIGSALPTWEAVAGVQGTMVSASTLETDIVGLTPGTYYLDDATPPATQCTGDGHEYGASGMAITSGIANTDPTLGAFSNFLGTRWNVYAPGTESLDIDREVANLATPVTVAVTQFVAGS
ncbi:MAG: hypothetical protein EXQ71_12055 [Acidimicrobiia bacterium]|nr:hypothetical protein [Acidimicrobiia bacterium]